jgi:hypothetical protein
MLQVGHRDTSLRIELTNGMRPVRHTIRRGRPSHLSKRSESNSLEDRAVVVPEIPSSSSLHETSGRFLQVAAATSHRGKIHRAYNGQYDRQSPLWVQAV